MSILEITREGAVILSNVHPRKLSVDAAASHEPDTRGPRTRRLDI